jgi:hypothetical protein
MMVVGGAVPVASGAIPVAGGAVVWTLKSIFLLKELIVSLVELFM